ncbi:Putative phosphatidic acid phosphatase type 2/haloperoxidase [Septoria linicola]|uniref:Phosphatidic acid phosphatase type 2/haloperoxidase n=1 Tax=Septoria linicola TaxID=215465 RepID=A0A9Q9EHP7_9PEZI|nr:putative phosphatidic acid phosphatase type 2/haloperoxidase [Septoria linicola]USW50249.1 Putative phosphatidic acid phosphatase type 2/haloperoxidase [Septoria linicola]
MPLFSRRNQPADANTAAAIGPSHEKHQRKAARNDYGDAFLSSRPTFGQWIKVTWPDILTMIVMGAIGLGVYEAPPAPSRSFPVYYPDGDVVYPQFAYPSRHEIIPIWAAALLAALVPIFFFLVMQIRIRSFWDVNNATIGLLYSLISAAVFQVFVKWLVGGLRPHFLAVCKPDTSVGGMQTGNGLGNIMYDRTICTGDENEINDALESMPSGHTTAAFGGFVFLYLYLNAKLKVWSNYHPAMWKLIVTYMPILAACLIGGSLTIDEFHNWYDVFAGAVIGTVFAFSSYRMVYASVWDFRFNHIPLSRHMPFTYSAQMGAFGGFQDAMFTRQVGWGQGMALGGAPFDVAGDSGMAGGLGGHGQEFAGGHHGKHHGVARKPVGSSPMRGDQMV